MEIVAATLALALLCYLIGSFPSAYVMGRLRYNVDIRKLGDGNLGAENVWRALGPPAGFVVGVADIGKGVLAAWVARSLIDSLGVAMLGGLAVVVGHNWPIFLGFRGGRGAATLIGVLLYLVPKATAPLALSGILLLTLSHSTIIYFGYLYIALPLVAWLTGTEVELIGYAIGMAALVGLTHLVTTRRRPKAVVEPGEAPIAEGGAASEAPHAP